MRCWLAAVLTSVALAGLSACGRELKVDPRQTLTGNNLYLNYELSVITDSTGSIGFNTSVIFFAGSSSGSPVEMPAGDSITVNGAPLVPQSTNASNGTSVQYFANGPATSGTYTFVWTDEATTYTNAFNVSFIPPTTPAAPPLVLSKSSGFSLSFSDLPANTVPGVYLQSASEPGGAQPTLTTAGSTVTYTFSQANLATSAIGPTTLFVSEAFPGTVSTNATGGSVHLSAGRIYSVTISN